MLDFINIRITDIIDIVLVAMLLLWVFRLIRGTHSTSIIIGIVLVYIASLIVRALGMELMSAILGALVSVGFLALVIIFQPEIRRFLQMLGTRRTNFVVRLLGRHANKDTAYINPIVKACADMSASYTGALILIRRNGNLSTIVESGIAIDAQVSSLLLRNIFFKNSPLHDGAVVIGDGRIVAAKCVLPLTSSEVPASFGTRHRAALGVSEETDAVVIVVSEETGRISVAYDGNIRVGLSSTELKAELMNIK